ncbi:hypothetical protein DFH27DRAFT_213350 [Peziza echinospora]|nr:hypothetical protein DFH27DRAFT_213350 [Peziza echinospora]
MGKLNYTNRKTSGKKLGETVKKDILKRIPEGSGRHAVKDSHLELSICGKGLGDDGLELVCEALCHTIQTGATKLEELSLSENGITIRGLAYLMRVIKLSSKDLKDLNLSGNSIKVVSDEEVSLWEEFLTRFREVTNLRRLDFSSNPLGPTRAFETLLRCYSRENPIYLSHSQYSVFEDVSEDDIELLDDSGHDFDSDDTDSYLRPRLQSLHLRRENSSSPPTVYSSESTSSRSAKLARRTSGLSHSLLTTLSTPPITTPELHGLRSIPFMILSNTEMMDISALHLSYLLPHHPLPRQILQLHSISKTSPAADHWDDLERQFPTGIVYRPNNSLTTLGLKALEIAEGYRGDPSPNKRITNTRRASDVSVGSPTSLRGGYFNSNPPISVVGSTNEMDRSRSKIQGMILKDEGPEQIELWRSAIKTLVLARALLLDAEPSSPIVSSSSSRNSCFDTPSSPRVSHATTTVLPTSPQNLSPSSYKLYRTSFHGSSTHSESLRQNNKLPGKLPEYIWHRIIAYAADSNNTMSTQQLRNVIEWGRQRETLIREKEFAGKLPSVQIWRFLEGLECLTYEV